VSFLRPKFVLLALFGTLIPVLSASGCTGQPFSAAPSATGGTDASGSGGSGHPPKSCGGPEDCDDHDPCTADLCTASGKCDTSPKCLGTEKCCQGDCAGCCEDSDCNDGVSCTSNQCFMGHCMFVPNDKNCADSEYCSATGCRARQTCGILAGEDVAKQCDDGSTCTTDACENNLCTHTYCTGTLCCEGQTPGCATECCNDSQCDKDDDPCTVGSCEAGKCSVKPLCGGGTQCCPSADGKTATCGACCSAADCDDRLGCTVDACGGGQCSHTPSGNCPAGYFCDPTPGRGCTKAPDCKTNADCVGKADKCQTNARCENGACHFDGCQEGTKCCAGGCATCCDASECSDNIDCTVDTCTTKGCSNAPMDSACMGGKCDSTLGCVACRDNMNSDCDDGVSCTTDTCTKNMCSHFSNCASGYCDHGTGQCVQCISDSDCQGGIAAAREQPAIIGTPCKVAKCVKGACQDSTVTCTGEQRCCSPYGCAILCVQTQ